MTGIFEEQDKTQMCDEIAAFLRKNMIWIWVSLEQAGFWTFFRRCWGIGSIIRRLTTQNSFTAGMRIIWKRIIMRCIRISSSR